MLEPLAANIVVATAAALEFQPVFSIALACGGNFAHTIVIIGVAIAKRIAGFGTTAKQVMSATAEQAVAIATAKQVAAVEVGNHTSFIGFFLPATSEHSH